MTTAQRILVPVDLDDGSRRALAYALSLADRSHASVDVLHVWEPPKLIRPDLMVYLESNGSAVSLAEFSQKQASLDLQKLVREAAGGRTDIKTDLALGAPAQTIVETAEQGDYDMIVMGTHGRHGLPRVLLGSVAEKVVRLARCPVLVVPAPERGVTAD